ncbi:MAG: S-layer homology domain-containing protein [Oscillospiraceae bacterium]|jgi:uncharacterized protein YkwD|nr:S-layer homology domain-containing protein [Oscillospiraceae bacterium]
MKSLKRLSAIILVVALLIGISVSATNAAGASLDNFKVVRSYGNSFRDVPSTAWYYKSVAASYGYAIINGRSDTRFAPDESLTGAEALTIAAKIHAIYTTGSVNAVAVNTTPWYKGAVDYCKANGLIGNEFDNRLTVPLTRAEMVHAWSKLLRAVDLPSQNTVNSLPDVSSSTPYSGEITAFYAAGILTGNDDTGRFAPNSSIIRSEAATIFMRLVDPTSRVSGRTYGESASSSSSESSESETSTSSSESTSSDAPTSSSAAPTSAETSSSAAPLGGISIGGTVAAAEAILGEPYRIAEGTAQYRFYGSYAEFTMLAVKNGKLTGVYTNYNLTATGTFTQYKDKNEGNRVYAKTLGMFGIEGNAVSEIIIYETTNAFRGLHGLAPYAWNSTLSSVARAHSADMGAKNYFDHTNLEGLLPWDRMSAAGYSYWSAGENIVANPSGIAIEMLDQWVNSAGHRGAMLSDFAEIGVGFAYNASSTYKYYATQVFGTPR